MGVAYGLVSLAASSNVATRACADRKGVLVNNVTEQRAEHLAKGRMQLSPRIEPVLPPLQLLTVFPLPHDWFSTENVPRVVVEEPGVAKATLRTERKRTTLENMLIVFGFWLEGLVEERLW